MNINIGWDFDCGGDQEMRKQVLGQISKILKDKYLENDMIVVDETSLLCSSDGLGLSSIDVIDIIIELEEKYNKEFDFGRKIESVSDLIDLICEQ